MSTPRAPLALFISYSHKDDEWRARLDAHLALLKRQQVFDVWHDRRISAGQEWAGLIDDALEGAHVVLLLVSADFLASDYCYDKEMKRALQRHDQGTARVVPVILRPCDWQSSDFGRLKAVPRDGKPITSHVDVDDAMTQVAVALRQVAAELADTSATGSATHGANASSTAGSGRNAGKQFLLQASDETSGDLPHPPPKKLKIGSIKIGPLEIGPFEFEWPRGTLGMRPLRTAAALLALLSVLAGLGYWVFLKTPLDEARDFMRRGQYASASKTLATIRQWAAIWSQVKALKQQAAFGERLDQGASIRDLAPELAKLQREFPRAPDVLVFSGLNSYWVDKNSEQAAASFTEAADCDEGHVYAHFLAADRRLDMAYGALDRSDAAGARTQAETARQLVDRAVKRSPFAKILPDYANQIAELDDFLGHSDMAYQALSGLAAQHSYSAVQSAMLAWRLAQPEPALRDSLEAVETAVARLVREPEDRARLEGWGFRLSAVQVLHIQQRNDKLCLLGRVIEVSKSLRDSSSGAGEASPLARDSPGAPGAGSMAVCGGGALAQRTVEVVCVEVLVALARIPDADRRRPVLERWATARLGCPQGLSPLPGLPAQTTATKKTATSQQGGRPA